MVGRLGGGGGPIVGGTSGGVSPGLVGIQRGFRQVVQQLNRRLVEVVPGPARVGWSTKSDATAAWSTHPTPVVARVSKQVCASKDVHAFAS